jgi:hypothetical protein
MSLFSTRAGGTGPAGGRPDMSQTMVSASSACSSDYTAGDSSCPCRDSVDFSNFLNSEGTALRPATNEHVLPTDYGLRGAQGELHSPGQAAPERRRYVVGRRRYERPRGPARQVQRTGGAAHSMRRRNTD